MNLKYITTSKCLYLTHAMNWSGITNWYKTSSLLHEMSFWRARGLSVPSVTLIFYSALLYFHWVEGGDMHFSKQLFLKKYKIRCFLLIVVEGGGGEGGGCSDMTARPSGNGKNVTFWLPSFRKKNMNRISCLFLNKC